LEKVSGVNISDEDMASEDISKGDIPEEDRSDEDILDEDISDEDMSIEGTSGETMSYLDACSPNYFRLTADGVQMTAWQALHRKVFSAPVRSPDLNGESERPTKRIRLSTQPVEEVRDEDDASSTLSSLLDAFDAEYQENFQHKQNNIEENLTTPIVFEISTICGTEASVNVNDTEEDMDSDDSCDEMLDGLTIALNAFWT
jgi:hypothetical protein